MYLLDTLPTSAVNGVVIGHDHRHNSERFARLSAAVFLLKGFIVYFYRGLVHTPLVPFGVKKFGAACGIMITASHNPKQDNGYKVYWENACQIIHPHDQGIVDSIKNNLEPWIWDPDLVDNSQLCIDKTKEVFDAYFEALGELSHHRQDNMASNFKFVYTAVHGVGTQIASRAFDTLALKPFIPTKEQSEPDPDFPTIMYPNPEEGKETLELAMKTAEKVGANVILATDPDADRFSISERQKNGEWLFFSGDQIGVMFACFVLDNYKKTGEPLDKVAMLTSTVSSGMLSRIAKKEGFYFGETLTGFKWLANETVNLEKNKGYKVLFAYEEAIGYMIGDVVKDKDGIVALVTCAELVIQLEKRGLMVSEYLDELYRKYGYFVSDNSYFICNSPTTINKIFDKIRYGGNPVKQTTDPNYPYKFQLSYPTILANHKVTYIRDLTIGYDSNQPDNKPIFPISKSSQMITFALDNGCNVTLRTSGTESKIKYYFELSGDDKSLVEMELSRIVKTVTNELLEPEKHGLNK